LELPLNLAHFNRYLDDENSLLVVTGDIPRITAGMKTYHEKYEIGLPSKTHGALLERMYGAAGLAAVSLADRESWGWTVTLPGKPFGFFCAIEPEGIVSARVRGAPSKNSAVVVQRMKPGEPVKESKFEPKATDPVKVVERYFLESDQIPTRIVVTPDGRGLLVQQMPGGQLDKFKGHTNDQLVDHYTKLVKNEELKQLDEVLLYYECRCNDSQVLNMLVDLPENKRKELWGDLPQLEIECPRCGREYVIKRNNIQS
jgi:hypothetical protein